MDLRLAWDDVPDCGVLAEAARWKRAGLWTGMLRFRREPAVTVAISETAHRWLLALRADVDRLEQRETELAQRMIDAQFKALSGTTPEERKRQRLKPAGWPQTYTGDRMRDLEEVLLGCGAVRGTPDWVARDRALARLLGRLRTQADSWPEKAGPPRLRRPHPRVVTLRLHDDAQPAGRPDENGCFWVEPIGWCAPGEPLSFVPGTASYVEAALIRRQWWLRFVFAEEAPPREKKTRKGTDND